MKLTELVNCFTLLKLKITTQLTAPLHIGGFAGDMLHNNFGIALKAVDPKLASDIYQTDGQVKQFVLTPDAPMKKQYAIGEILSFELTLFNQICSYLPQILQALSLWQQQGFIPDKQRHLSARFTLTATDCDTPLMPSQRLFAFNQCPACLSLIYWPMHWMAYFSIMIALTAVKAVDWGRLLPCIHRCDSPSRTMNYDRNQRLIFTLMPLPAVYGY
jgi:hypothetical protein